MNHSEQHKVHVIVVAAGVGSRFSEGKNRNRQKNHPKQYQLIGEHSVLNHSIQAFEKIDLTAITVVLHPDDTQWKQQQKTINSKHTILTTIGGDQRHDSVRNGIKSLHADPQDWVLVHDAARPCVSHEEIQALIDCCIQKQQGGLLVKPINDTIKYSQHGITADKTMNRNQMYAALTPQMFRCQDLLKALTVFEAGSITDESSALEAQGHKPIMVKGRNTNIKITSFEDLAIAQAILKQQGRL